MQERCGFSLPQLKKEEQVLNVQSKMKAVHHLDVPWRPSDIQQRNGRIIRQGNENKEVDIYHYITKGSFDNYLWATQENKLRYN